MPFINNEIHTSIHTSIHSSIHTSIHNTFLHNGWFPSQATNLNSNKIVYKTNISKDISKDISKSISKANPYAEFIIDYVSSQTLTITVPIPFRDCLMSYQNTFPLSDTSAILAYLQIHLANYHYKYQV